MTRSLDRLTLLETFTRIADRGSITAAAHDLGLSQASVSRQLKELEDRMGAELIRRTTHSLALTGAGSALLRDAREIIASWNAFEEHHAGTNGDVKGPLHVVAPVALGQRHLVDIAVTFQKRHPHVTLSWQLEDESIRFAEVGCDCWVKVGAVPDETLIVRRLGSVERLVVANPDVAAGRQGDDPEAAVNPSFIALAPFEGARIDLQRADGKQAHLLPHVRVTTNDILAGRHAALAGAGAAIMPRWLVQDDLIAGRLVDVLPGWRAATLPINAAFLPTRHRPRRLALFLEALATGVGALPGVDAGG
ncbi:MAG: LysR family transcriptional regulator [Pseudomonadota bacterium]